MTAPVPESSPFPGLAEVAAMPAGADREQQAYNTVYRLLVSAPPGDQVYVKRVRSEARRLRIMDAGLFDSLAASAAADAELGADHQAAAVASPPRPRSLHPAPEGIRAVPGSPGFGYLPATPDHPGALWEERGNPKHWHQVLGWAPAVRGFLETPAESGAGATAYYYVIAAAGREVTADGAELAAGEPWKLLPVPGTGAKRVREVLANVVLAEAAEMTIGRALTHTGWHRADDGERFYVHADGRAHDGRPVVLVGRDEYARLAAAAAPVPELAPAAIAEALRSVAAHGRGPALAGLGVGVRSLAHSLHRVPGGFIAVGAPNAGKSSLGWHARCVSVASAARADAWPPIASATFADTKSKIEGALNYEADMPALLDDAALTDKSSRAEVAEVTARLEMVFRALANDAPVRGRMDRTMLPRPANYVRSPVIATIQGSVADVPVQNSLLRRVALLPVARGAIDVRWYRAPGNAPGLVGPLRALGELAVNYLAALGDRAAAYIAAKDAEAREALASALEAVVPGWEDGGEGLAGVADIAACALAGALVAAELAEMPAAELAAPLVAYLADALAEQAGRMSDAAAEATAAEALGEVIRAALLDGRAHVRDHQGDAAPAVPGLTEQEQGLEALGVSAGLAVYRGRGVPCYYLADAEALGVRAEMLHKLIRASGDTRLAVRTPHTLPAYLVREGAALASDQKTGRGTHQRWIGGENKRLVLMPAAALGFSPASENDDPGTARTARTARPHDNGTDSNASEPLEADRTARPQVTGTLTSASRPRGDDGDRSNNSRDGAPSGSNGSTAAPSGSNGSGAAPSGSALCRKCHTLLSPWLRGQGAEYHIGCSPEVMPATAPPPRPAPADNGREHQGDERRQAAAPSASSAPTCTDLLPNTAGALLPNTADEAPARRRWVVLGGDGRAYASGGEILEIGPPALDGCRANIGGVAALAEALGVLGDPAGTVYVTAAAREALGLPAALSGELSKWGDMPHLWVESLDTARWYVPEGAGLGHWVKVYRRAEGGERTYQGVAVAFPEWIASAPSLGPLAAAELAAALDLIHQATTYGGNGKGGVEFANSPAATFARLVDKRLRYSRKGRPEPVTLPPPYDRTAKRPRGAPSPLRPPGMHAAPPAEVPAGWTVAQLDVRSCYPSAAIGTDFGVGEAVHRKGGEIKQRGAYLVRAMAGASVHETLTPLVPAASAGRAREVLAWLDYHAAAWLAECGVPLEVVESWTWPEHHRVFASAVADLTKARQRYQAGGTVPELAAAAVIKAGPNTFLGGWLASDFGGARQADDWRARWDWWLAVKTQAEVRKQRNLLAAIKAGRVRVLASQNIDSVYVAAPELADIIAMPGTAGRPAVGDDNGKFKIEAHAVVGAELAAVLASAKDGHIRRRAIAAALGTGE